MPSETGGDARDPVSRGRPKRTNEEAGTDHRSRVRSGGRQPFEAGRAVPAARRERGNGGLTGTAPYRLPLSPTVTGSRRRTNDAAENRSSLAADVPLPRSGTPSSSARASPTASYPPPLAHGYRIAPCSSGRIVRGRPSSPGVRPALRRVRPAPRERAVQRSRSSEAPASSRPFTPGRRE